MENFKLINKKKIEYANNAIEKCFNYWEIEFSEGLRQEILHDKRRLNEIIRFVEAL